MANWSKHHLGQLIILAGVIILCLVVLVLFSWFIGFYANGFYGFKFDLSAWIASAKNNLPDILAVFNEIKIVIQINTRIS